MASQEQTPASMGTGKRMPFSIEQEFLRMQHEHDGSTAGFGDRPISSGGWRLTGELDPELLRRALDDVVARHEALRTAVVATEDGWQQEVRPPAPATLTVRDLSGTTESRDTAAERFLNEVEAATFDADSLPLVWAYLGRFDAHDAVLVLVAYLPMIDVWSIGVVMRDLAECYAARREQRSPELPDAPQYRDYLAWRARQEPPSESFAYWRRTLDGARAFSLESDRPPATHPSGTTRVDRFAIDPDLGARGLALARSSGCTPFMLLFAVHVLQLHRLTGRTDGVVWTLTSGPGRRHDWLADTVGYFVNMSPLRTDISGCETFRDVLTRVRSACVSGFPHEVPFVHLAQEAGEAIGALEQGGMVVPGFSVVQNPASRSEQTAGGLAYRPLRRRLSQDAGPQIPDDAILYTVEVDDDGGLYYAMSSSADRFDQRTTRGMADEFLRLFRDAVTDPDRSVATLLAPVP